LPSVAGGCYFAGLSSLQVVSFAHNFLLISANGEIGDDRADHPPPAIAAVPDALAQPGRAAARLAASGVRFP